MQRVILVGMFFSVTGAVYFGLSIDEYDSIAPVVAFNCAAILIIIIATLRAYRRPGNRD